MGFGGGDSEIGLLFRILADSSQAAAELAKFRATAARDVDGVLAEFRKSNAYKADFKSTTDVLIAESQRAIANAEKTALSASHALQTTASAITTAQKEASGLANSFISTYGNALLMTGAIVGAGAALIGLAKYATDAAAELWDAHQKTGFLVESLSALKNLGDTAGVSFQSTSVALGIFEKNMGAAHNATSKQSALFKSLNIDIDDHERALRQAFVALFNMKEGEEQTSAAMQLFGRSGKEMIGIIQESNGNLDNAMAKFKALGTLISTEDAKAADEFQDALKGAGQQALALAKDIGTSLIPVFQVLLGVINSVIVAVRGLVAALQWLMSFSSPALEKLKELQDRANFKMPLIPKMPTLPGTQHFFDEVPVQSDISGGAEEGNKTSMDTLHKMMQESAKAASEAKRQEAERLQGLKEASSARLEVLQIEERAAGRIRQEQLEEAERAYKKGEISLKQYTTRITNIEGAYLQTRKENIQKERDELKAQYDNAEQIKVKGLALDEKVKIAEIEHDKNLKTYKAKADQQEEERQKRHLEAEEERQKISDDARIAQFKDDAERRKMTYKAAEDAILAIQARSLERQGLAALEARNKEKEGTAEYERLNDIYLAIQAKAAAFKEEVERRKREALKKTLELETAITTKAQIEARGGKGAQPSVGGETVDDFLQTHTHGSDVTPKTRGEVAGLQTNMDAFQAWGDKINEIFGLTGENAKVFGQIISQTFGSRQCRW
jgi:DNA repair exonuclease SbcCD ATPase subunit